MSMAELKFAAPHFTNASTYWHPTTPVFHTPSKSLNKILSDGREAQYEVEMATTTSFCADQRDPSELNYMQERPCLPLWSSLFKVNRSLWPYVSPDYNRYQ